MAELSVIIPYVCEWPLNVFTIRNIAEELRDRVDFEIIAVDNFCDQVKAQGAEQDRTTEHLEALQRGHKWLKVLRYTDKLSHWQSKNLAIKNASGKFLFFVDSHCVVGRDALFNMFDYYRKTYENLNGTIHLPLTYHIMEYHRLIYKLQADLDRGHVHYSFSAYRDSKAPYEVPCMSTCGMMITKDMLAGVGMWPEQLGIYGGGENFINFTLSVLGKKKWIMPGQPLCHHGDKRKYHWYGDDMVRNRCIATYLFGDKDLALTYVENCKGHKGTLHGIYEDVLGREDVQAHKKHIDGRKVISIQDWIQQQTELKAA